MITSRKGIKKNVTLIEDQVVDIYGEITLEGEVMTRSCIKGRFSGYWVEGGICFILKGYTIKDKRDIITVGGNYDQLQRNLCRNCKRCKRKP